MKFFSSSNVNFFQSAAYYWIVTYFCKQLRYSFLMMFRKNKRLYVSALECNVRYEIKPFVLTNKKEHRFLLNLIDFQLKSSFCQFNKTLYMRMKNCSFLCCILIFYSFLIFCFFMKFETLTHQILMIYINVYGTKMKKKNYIDIIAYCIVSVHVCLCIAE